MNCLSESGDESPHSKSDAERELDGWGALDIVRRIPADPKSIAFYDLKLPGRREWLEGEAAALREAGFEVVELPDGAVIEEAWEGAPETRLSFEEIRVELGGDVDGEVFFRAARRATWLESAFQPERIFAPGIAESLAAWLVSKRLEVELLLAFDAQQSWKRGLLDQLASNAEKLSDGTGKFLHDALQHGPIQSKRHRLGPIKWKTRGAAPNAAKRAKLLADWI